MKTSNLSSILLKTTFNLLEPYSLAGAMVRVLQKDITSSHTLFPCTASWLAYPDDYRAHVEGSYLNTINMNDT
jgi:hypothetical protein